MRDHIALSGKNVPSSRSRVAGSMCKIAVLLSLAARGAMQSLTSDIDVGEIPPPYVIIPGY